MGFYETLFINTSYRILKKGGKTQLSLKKESSNGKDLID